MDIGFRYKDRVLGIGGSRGQISIILSKPIPKPVEVRLHRQKLDKLVGPLPQTCFWAPRPRHKLKNHACVVVEPAGDPEIKGIATP